MSNVGLPVTLSVSGTAPARAYVDAARRLKGEEVAMTIDGERRRFIGKLFGRVTLNRSICSAVGALGSARNSRAAADPVVA